MKRRIDLPFTIACIIGAVMATALLVDLLRYKSAVEPPCSCTEGCVVKTFETATCVYCPGELACCTVRGEAP